MKRTEFKQINTPELWDGYYIPEEIAGQHRILLERRQWLVSMIKFWGGSRHTFLDVGCGWGEVFEFLRKEGFRFEFTGIDICSKTIEKQQHKKDRFVLGRAEKMPFESGTFDVVWCGETIEHLDDPRKALREIQRVTKKGGLMLITVPLDNFNNALEHTYYITRKDVCTWYDNATLINYTLYQGGEQCAAFINDRKKVKWPEYDSIHLRSK